ncbi:MAG TPA: zinc-dependent alcohol dehydrogenase family protein [Thermoleophilia bacterium]|nr:zinc-dependent alcohol dehydrogenase family protein [Thermoleophilia bacterium]
MDAMLFEGVGRALKFARVPMPEPGAGQVGVRVKACGICRTDLHIIDGELAHPKLPLVLGHQIVGTVETVGEGVSSTLAGQLVGIPWLGWTCGHCRFCLSGRENLCDLARFTGYDIDGGFAEYTVADARFCFLIPQGFAEIKAAPLLCAGLIGFRSLRMAGDPERLGIYGYGAAAHIVTQVAQHEGRKVYAFTRPGDHRSQEFALEMGAVWAGDTDHVAPEELDAAIIFAPAGELVPVALRATSKGGMVVCGGIHMTDIPSFPYEILWGERGVRSVANLTRKDGTEFLDLAPRIPIRTEVDVFSLQDAPVALDRLRRGEITGAAVLRIA